MRCTSGSAACGICCVHKAGLSVESWGEWDALPERARALAGACAFSTPAWYRSVSQAAMTPGARACFQVVSDGSEFLGVFPMQEGAGELSALTTPYTVLWSPLLRTGLDGGGLFSIGRALGRVWRHRPLTRLDALDGDAAWLAPLLAGLRRSGLLPLRFDHFGNWHLNVAGQGWDDYLAARPGALRSAIVRRTRRLMEREGAAFTMTDGAEGLETALAAYEQVYAASWKQPEPFPGFNPALMRACAAEGGLRLGALALRGTTVAVQFWLVHAGWAGVQKLAHDEHYKHFAPGTVLTALMIRRLMEGGRVTELDFGRGDDPYKESWTGQRRQRVGVVLAAAWHPRGAMHAARHGAGQLLAAARGWRDSVQLRWAGRA